MVFNRARFEFIKGVFVREMELYSWKLLVHGKKEKRAKKPQRDPDAGKNKKWIVEMGFREW